ncbi:MAG: hypothetical protein SF182_02580 [Deltaproteobacteria bacterium]|nr:hypothetical protein [Deltaproteobacteria bacterium]
MGKLLAALLVLVVLDGTAWAAEPGGGGSSAAVGCDAVRDLSHFRRLAYRQQSAIGFCSTLNSVLRATLVPDHDGLVLMTVRYASSTSECGDDRDPRCVVEGPQTCRRLSADDTSRLRQALAAVRMCPTKDPSCSGPVGESCLTRVLTWNDESFSDACSEQPRLDPGEGRRIEALIESLAGPTVACGPKNDDGLSGN